MSWDTTPLYFFSWDFINLQQKEPSRYKFDEIESLKFGTLMGSFCQNDIKFQLQKYRRVISHDTEEWCKVWIKPDVMVSKMAWGIGWMFIWALKVWKIVQYWAFWQKHIMFQLENFRGIMCHDTKGWCKI